MKREAAVVCVVVLAVLLSEVASAGPTLDLQLIPKTVTDTQPAQLVIRVTSSSQLKNATLTVQAPPHFELTARRFDVSGLQGERTCISSIVATGSALEGGERVLLAELASGDSGLVQVVASKTLTLDYQPELPMWTYLFLGALGISLGYALRLVIKVLAATTPPAAVRAIDGAPAPAGPITSYVQGHFYQVDFAVTVSLGLLALLAMVHNGHPPEIGRWWATILVAGVGLGLLTNSELVTKLR